MWHPGTDLTYSQYTHSFPYSSSPVIKPVWPQFNGTWHGGRHGSAQATIAVASGAHQQLLMCSQIHALPLAELSAVGTGSTLSGQRTVPSSHRITSIPRSWQRSSWKLCAGGIYGKIIISSFIQTVSSHKASSTKARLITWPACFSSYWVAWPSTLTSL